MKIKRLTALELLNGLRALDGVTTGGQFIAFTFEPAVVDLILENILQLRTFSESVDAYRTELAKLLKIEAGMSADNPAIAKFNANWIEWINGEIALDLVPISKESLNLGVNRLPVSTRERLLPILQA